MTVPNPSQLLADGPTELLDRSLDDYGAFLRAAGEIRREHAEAVDYVVRHHVARLFVSGADEGELSEAYGALRRLVPVSRETELAEWTVRWRALADLVDARLQSLAHRDVDKARSLAHVDEIVELVSSHPGLSQNEIGAELELSAPNLSRILGVMEAHELIGRRVVGREKHVYPGRLADKPDAPSTPATDHGSRFGTHLCLSA